MKRTEKIAIALLIITLGLVLTILKEDVISILMTALGLGLIVLGCMDLYHKCIPPAVVKIVVGAIIILFGWLLVSAVLYILAAGLIIFGILMLYELLKKRAKDDNLLQTIGKYAIPSLCLLIGILLLFNQGGTVAWVFVLSGIATILEGGVLLLEAFFED